mgnify:CR=1 FL=1
MHRAGAKEIIVTDISDKALEYSKSVGADKVINTAQNKNLIESELESEEELDDYAYRVAGSVGVFWSKISLAHLISLPSEKEEEFLEKGIRFGKSLQMINILRDIPEDLRFVKCYQLYQYQNDNQP